jgi:hypothetical protein
MVSLPAGSYLCHAFDLNSPLASLPSPHRTESLRDPPLAIRFEEVAFEELSNGDHAYIGEIGVLIVLQLIAGAGNSKNATSIYEDKTKFDELYKRLIDSVQKPLQRTVPEVFNDSVIQSQMRNGQIEPVHSFLVHLGSEPEQISWESVSLNATDSSATLLIQAVLIDMLRRMVDRRLSMLQRGNDYELVERKHLVELADALIAVSSPSRFLIERPAVERMQKFFDNWKLTEDVTSVRSAYSESSSSDSHFSDRLAAHRAIAMNYFIASIAVLSLTQVLPQLKQILSHFAMVDENGIGMAIAISSLVIFAAGITLHVIRPKWSMYWDARRRTSRMRRLTGR